ncbi:hypothetical protein EZS27_024755 [termite gut metagenome]|uniref:HTH psq-type domain-containing protein n=1 Tax=termite gut metagenome TaxID=433724 RepID=A0A5J4R035_9ZZZZ
MVDQNVSTPEFARMVAKSYYTSDKSLVRIGKEFTVKPSTVYNLELESQLKEEQMRSITLNQMIDMAEQELNISIRKKSGAKQSKRRFKF